jgi:hypothetical protein
VVIEWGKVAEVATIAGATLVAAWTGARLAFKYNFDRETERQTDERVEACNRAMMVLMQQYNHLLNYRAQLMDPVRSNEARHFLLPPSNPVGMELLHFDAASLAFLIETIAEELPFMFSLADRKFHSALGAISDRSEHHREFQLALARDQQPLNVTGELSELESKVGERLTIVMKKATDQVYDLVDAALKSLESAGRDGPAVLRSLFQRRKIIGFAPPQ